LRVAGGERGSAARAMRPPAAAGGARGAASAPLAGGPAPDSSAALLLPLLADDGDDVAPLQPRPTVRWADAAPARDAGALAASAGNAAFPLRPALRRVTHASPPPPSPPPPALFAARQARPSRTPRHRLSRRFFTPQDSVADSFSHFASP
jgi:hypothetical protein